MAILWSPEGADDFLTALSYLCERSPAAAERLVARVNEPLQRLVALSMDGPERTRTSGAIVRSWPVPPFVAVSRLPFVLGSCENSAAMILRTARDLQDPAFRVDGRHFTPFAARVAEPVPGHLTISREVEVELPDVDGLVGVVRSLCGPNESAWSGSGDALAFGRRGSRPRE